jgi:hypothetical protein
MITRLQVADCARAIIKACEAGPGRCSAYGRRSLQDLLVDYRLRECLLEQRLHLVVTLGGVILDVELTAASADERAAAADLLPAQRGRTIISDKGYVSESLAEHLETTAGVRLIALRRVNQRQPLPAPLTRLIERFRQIIETVNGQLADQFGIEHGGAHSFSGLCARIYTKLAAHTLCIYLNRLLGNPDWLQIKALAFPN